MTNLRRIFEKTKNIRIKKKLLKEQHKAQGFRKPA